MLTLLIIFLVFIIKINNVFCARVYNRCIVNVDGKYMKSANIKNDNSRGKNYHTIYYTSYEQYDGKTVDCFLPNPWKGNNIPYCMSSEININVFNEYVTKNIWNKETAKRNEEIMKNYTEETPEDIISDYLIDQGKELFIKSLQIMGNKDHLDLKSEWENDFDWIGFAQDIYSIINELIIAFGPNQVQQMNEKKNNLINKVKNMDMFQKIEILFKLKGWPYEFNIMERDVYLIGCDGDNLLLDDIEMGLNIGCYEEKIVDGSIYKLISKPYISSSIYNGISTYVKYTCHSGSLKYYYNGVWNEKCRCLFTIIKDTCYVSPEDQCSSLNDDYYLVSRYGNLYNSYELSNENIGTMVVKYSGFGSNCSVKNGAINNGILGIDNNVFVYFNNGWKKEVCQEAIGFEGGRMINSDNNKEVISCEIICNDKLYKYGDPKVCYYIRNTVSVGSNLGETRYYINKAGNKDSHGLIECEDNKDCITKYGYTGYYIYDQGNGIIKCEDGDCEFISITNNILKRKNGEIININNMYDNIFLNKGSDKNAKPFIECKNNKCKSIAISNLGYYISDIESNLVKCESTDNCYYVYSSGKNKEPTYYLHTKKDKVIRCNNQNRNCSYLYTNYNYNYFINNDSETSKEKPLIRCNDKTCENIEIPSEGYYLNSGEKKLDYAIINCSKTFNYCYLINGEIGVAYINQSESKQYKNMIIICYEDECENRYVFDDIEYYIDGGSKYGNYYKNIIQEIDGSLISFEFGNKRNEMGDGYYINSAMRGETTNGIILCETKNYCKLITPEYSDTFRTGNNRYIKCNSVCIEQPLTLSLENKGYKYYIDVDSIDYEYTVVSKKLRGCNDGVCITIKNAFGYYLNKNKDGVINCENDICSVLNIKSIENWYFLNSSYNKGTHPLISCTKTLCKTLKAPRIGYYINNSTGNLIECKTENNCNYKEIENGIFMLGVNNNKQELIKCENSKCSVIEVGINRNYNFIYKYFINSGFNKEDKPLIRCYDSKCETTTAKMGYYINGESLSSSNQLIKCKSTTECSIIEGIDGASYISNNDCQGSNKNQSHCLYGTVICCYNGICEERSYYAKRSNQEISTGSVSSAATEASRYIYIDGDSYNKEGGYFTNVINVSDLKLKSEKFKSTSTKNLGYYLNIANCESTKNAVVRCVDNGKCKIIETKCNLYMYGYKDKYIYCTDKCIHINQTKMKSLNIDIKDIYDEEDDC